jgi:hypothetical protein
MVQKTAFNLLWFRKPHLAYFGSENRVWLIFGSENRIRRGVVQ